jgi:murein DD-endopeptidase MepM/ murein hydrolase activator NlpD
MRIRIDGLVLVSIGLIIVMAASLISDRAGSAASLSANEVSQSMEVAGSQTSDELSGNAEGVGSGRIQIDNPQAAALESAPVGDTSGENGDPVAFEAPYDDYTVTQGPHGEWYGHLAIDIAAGKDTPIKSPIHGTVTDLFIDQWGNPNLVIENDIYRVSLLHGNFSVDVYTPVELGQEVGNEGNNGYTTDMRGNSCAGRNCGYHTHLNVFDKRLGENVNPLDLIK